MLFSGFTPFDIRVEPDVTIHGIRGGTGPPLLLLHGAPQTHHIWHRVAPSLVDTYTLVALDLRGYGASSKPAGDASHKAYSKTTMAQDCLTVMRSLGFSRFLVCAHDRGARVAHRLAVDYPSAVAKMLLLDICPTLAMFEKTDAKFAKLYWHWFFLNGPAPLPENLINASPVAYIEGAMGQRYGGLAIFHPQALREYTEAMKQPDTVHGLCEDYRAAASVDCEEARRDIEAGRKVKAPLRVLWGKHGVIEKCFDALAEWRAVAEGEVSGEAVESGHYIAEEAPEALVKHIKEFLLEG